MRHKRVNLRNSVINFGAYAWGETLWHGLSTKGKIKVTRPVISQYDNKEEQPQRARCLE